MNIRLGKAISELNIGLQTAVEFLEKKTELGEVKAEPSFKLNDAQYDALVKAFHKDKEVRNQADKLFPKKTKEKKRTNENIDVINYTANTKLFIQRALSPAQVSSINLDEENRKAEVFLHPEEVSLAIGRGGLNIKLASMLTEYTIDVFREVAEGEADEDIYLDEFSDEVDQWVIDAIKSIGLDTAKAVLNAPREMLVEKADLEEETVDSLLRVLRAEFE